jgi:hypothetical protein
MASLTRKFLTTLGIEEDKADQIIERHNEVLTEIKTERDEYKEKAEQLPDIQKQLNDYKEAESKAEKDPYKVKYEALKEEYNDYKTKVTEKETTAKKEATYRQLLKECGISEKRIDAVLKVSDINAIEYDDEGNVKEGDKLKEAIKAEWSDFIETKGEKGASVATPPTSTNSTVKSKKEILEIKDTTERQKAWAEYIAQSQKGN